MPKPPRRMGVTAENINQTRDSILTPTPTSKQDPKARSPKLLLPPHLDRLIDLPWTSKSSRQVDQWLWSTEQEFETVGGWR